MSPDSPGAKVRVGCAGLPPRMSLDRYFEGLPFLESDILLRGKPAAKTLRSWRKRAPAGAAFSLLFAPSGFDAAEAELLAEATAALAPEAVVIRLAPAMAPSAANRDRLTRWLEEDATTERLGGASRVLEAGGLWEPEQAWRFAEDRGLGLALDPLARDPLGEIASLPGGARASGLAYYRLIGLGRARRRYEVHELEELAALLEEPAAQTFLAFAHVEKWRDARRFAAMLAAGA